MEGEGEKRVAMFRNYQSWMDDAARVTKKSDALLAPSR